MELAQVARALPQQWSDEAECRAALAAVQRLRGMLDAYEAKVVARLGGLAGSFPEGVVAEVHRVGLAAASRLTERVRVAEELPELGRALAEGATGGAHLDVVASAARALSAAARERLAAAGSRLAAAAATQSRREFEATVQQVVRAVGDDDGLGRLERQRRASRLRTWVDRDSGMWCLRGEFDPEAGARLDARLRRTVERCFRETMPDTAPVDPVEPQHHLAALALARLVDGDAPAGATCDLTVLVDAETLLGAGSGDPTAGNGGIADTGPFGLPIEVVRRWACSADITPVVVAPGGQRIFAGRTIRVANRAQRRLLRVLYRTCALCDTVFEHCAVHHVDWHGRDHGPTDIDNLLPLCSRHHHAAHEGGWALRLDTDRRLTVRRPDGRSTIHSPPTVRAA